ncbi:glycoside hydrolase family 32 protein [Ectobacillus funiculus]|uniref:glycoside hydrolase family 32 protein n=1 Tax=Ectobacillus funiculus TaxID=137993 RepID=UPI00397AF731
MKAINSSCILKAQQVVEEARKKVEHTPYRLGYHIMAPAHWINDPNGLIQWNGEYHVFYQHHPYSPKGGPIHWGHVKSKDLVRWEHLPIALAPGEEYDKSGCFSGSAVDNNGTLTLIYTGHISLNEETDEFREVQCIATSEDGIHFTKHPQNPVITEPPAGGSWHFRDPKVWKHSETWYMVLGNQMDGLGNVLLYESADLVNWEYSGILVKSDGKLGYMLECPDFIELNGKHVLLSSPQGIQPEGDHYQNLYQTGYLVGEFDYETKQFTHGEFEELDKGFDFYAVQSFGDEKGRRIVIGWMNMWESQMPEQEHGWAGALTIPRELQLHDDGKLLMKPVVELKSLRENNISVQTMIVSENVRLDEVKGDRLEIIAKFSLANTSAEKFGLKVRCSENGKEHTIVSYDVKEEKVIVDRSQSGRGEGGIRKGKIETLHHDVITLQLFIDRSSLELFVNEGELVMTNRIYPDPASLGVELFTEGGSVKLIELEAWTLKDIWV